jgi:hypothetical protein
MITKQCANVPIWPSTEIVRICPIMVMPSANSPMSYNGQTHSRMSLRAVQGACLGRTHTIYSHSHAMCGSLWSTNKNNSRPRARYKVSIKAPFRARHTLYFRFFIAHRMWPSVKRQLFVWRAALLERCRRRVLNFTSSPAARADLHENFIKSARL